MSENGQLRAIELVRLWTVTVLGAALIVVGFLHSNAELIVLGFGVLGAEPLLRARSETK